MESEPGGLVEFEGGAGGAVRSRSADSDPRSEPGVLVGVVGDDRVEAVIPAPELDDHHHAVVGNARDAGAHALAAGRTPAAAFWTNQGIVAAVEASVAPTL